VDEQEQNEELEKESRKNRRTLDKHFRTHGKFAKSAEKIQGAIDKLIDAELQDDSPDLWRLEKIAVTLSHAEKVCGKAIEGQRAAASLDYEDLSKAHQRLKREGYEIITRHDYDRLIELIPEPPPATPESGWVSVVAEDVEPMP
jgi:hypothetical protein